MCSSVAGGCRISGSVLNQTNVRLSYCYGIYSAHFLFSSSLLSSFIQMHVCLSYTSKLINDKNKTSNYPVFVEHQKTFLDSRCVHGLSSHWKQSNKLVLLILFFFFNDLFGRKLIFRGSVTFIFPFTFFLLQHFPDHSTWSLGFVASLLTSTL